MGSLAVTRGEERVRTWDPGDGGWVKAFCGICGGHLFTTSTDAPEALAVRLGALDGEPGVRPSAHQFTAYAAPWEPIPEDGFPRFAERMPRA